MKMRFRFLALLSGLRIHCRDLWCRSQIWLGSCVAVAVVSVGSCSSDSIPSLGTSICGKCGPKKQKKKKAYFVFLFVWPYLRHVGVPGPGIEPIP